jgi:hypothetical protein
MTALGGKRSLAQQLPREPDAYQEQRSADENGEASRHTAEAFLSQFSEPFDQRFKNSAHARKVTGPLMTAMGGSRR